MVLTLISFVVVMSVLVFVHEAGHFIVAKRSGIIVDEFGMGFPPRLVKLGERNGTVYSINAIPFGGFVRLRGEDDPSDQGSFAGAPKLARTLTLLAGPVMNFLLSIVLFASLTMMTGVPDLRIPGATVTGTAPGSPAAEAGLRSGDRIVAADGAPILRIEDLQALTSKKLGQPVVYQFIREDPASRTREVINATIIPRTNPPKNEGALGINLSVPFRPAGPGEAVQRGMEITGRIIWLTFQIPANMLREGRPISDAGFMGPVGIAVTTGEVVRSALDVNSIQPILNFVGLLSAALGITNLLPIPGLDGGRLIFILAEAIRRKRVEPAQEGLVHLIGFGILLVLVGVLTVREVSALLTGTYPAIDFH